MIFSKLIESGLILCLNLFHLNLEICLLRLLLYPLKVFLICRPHSLHLLSMTLLCLSEALLSHSEFFLKLYSINIVKTKILTLNFRLLFLIPSFQCLYLLHILLFIETTFMSGIVLKLSFFLQIPLHLDYLLFFALY